LQDGSLGLIETHGLVGALEAADAAAKAAPVTALGYRLSGGGLVTLALTGPVAAVRVAVSAGVARAARVGRVHASHVIARPAENVAYQWLGTNQSDPGIPPSGRAAPDEGAGGTVAAQKELPPEEPAYPPVDAAKEPVSPGPGGMKEESGEVGPGASGQAVTCNLCGDPDCPRHKGEPRSMCLHYFEP